MQRFGMRLAIAGLTLFLIAGPLSAADFQVAGEAASGVRVWEPALFLREQTPASGDRSRPVLYIHGATFPSALSIFWKFDGRSWADALNESGFSVWGLDFAGYGGSEAYPSMKEARPPVGEPLGRAPEAARQIERAVRYIIAQTGAKRVSIIAHSWGTMAAGLFATKNPDLVDRLVFFAPITHRQAPARNLQLGPWRYLTVEEQHKRFVEDVPAAHAAVLLDRHFAPWAAAYLAMDRASAMRQPPSIKTVNGPVADILAAWSGNLPYDPAHIEAPLLVVRGEWDSLCKDGDAQWLLQTAIASPEKKDVKIAEATHLMHLEEKRGELYRAASEFLLSAYR